LIKVLLTGSKGQLGFFMEKIHPKGIELISLDKNQFDLSKINNIKTNLEDIKPDFIINCGAYTNVDMAENEKETVMNINANSVKEIALYLKKNGGNLIQISTDYVFDGLKSNAYKVNDNVFPLNQYGLSKARAEKFIKEILGDTNQGIVIRTSWLMGTFGKNFLLTMIKLHQIKEEINVVSDQISCPTSTKTLAEACWKVMELKLERNLCNNKFMPILHWSDKGIASWYDVAIAIGEISTKYGLVDLPAFVNPVKSENFPTIARRPSFSLLDCTSSREFLALDGEYWRKSLEVSIKSIVENKNG
tara:strand:+ start:2066 stop:2977 length:912 start_codon:yes stop_codon:yes gene_type:complete